MLLENMTNSWRSRYPETVQQDAFHMLGIIIGIASGDAITSFKYIAACVLNAMPIKQQVNRAT